MERLKINIPIIVEGKYDKIKLSAVCDACIVTTDGFGVFSKSEKLALIKKLAEKNGIIILTDSDGAGKLIRSHITSAVPKDKIYQLYVPKIEGKEKRKDKPSKEGYLGVEGMDASLLRDLIARFAEKNGIPTDGSEASPLPKAGEITKTDLYFDNFSGSPDSSSRRDALAKEFALPSGMTANALLAALNILCSKEEYRAAADKINEAPQ